MERNSKLLVCAVATALIAFAGPAAATPLLSNLIVNGDAEASVGAASFSVAAAPTGWSTTSNFTAMQYAAGGANELNNADSTAFGGGLNYFAGGPINALSTARQSIAIGDLAASIDAGDITAAFSALIGGFISQRDNMLVQAIFLDASSAALLTLTLGPVTPAERGDESELLARSANTIVPVGTRSVDILMTSTRLDGDYNDGYADNLSLVLRGGEPNGVPLPGTLWLVGLGLMALGAHRIRRS
ncbi:MAG: PEP-CTERM sorting domain-containing protein [Burkholderiales bacterium]|nr:PEP-CTERM sorting domain-containing protein [Burkholderiales bacterium]